MSQVLDAATVDAKTAGYFALIMKEHGDPHKHAVGSVPGCTVVFAPRCLCVVVASHGHGGKLSEPCSDWIAKMTMCAVLKFKTAHK